MASRTQVSCGLDLYCVNDIGNSLSTATNAGFQFVAIPIVHPRFKREFIFGKAKNRQGAFTRSDLVLSSQDWNTLIVGKVSSSLDIDSRLPDVRKNSEKALEQELNYAAHLGLPAILVSVKSANCVNLARCIHNRILSSVSYQGMFQVWVHVPMRSPKDESKIYFNQLHPDNNDESIGLTDVETFLDDTWNWWNIFRSICNTEKKIGLALELSAELPTQSEIDRWLGEPVRCVIVPTSIFLTNKKGYPVLSRAHQLIVQRSYKLDAQIMIKGVKQHGQIKHYHQYMEHLWLTQSPDDSLAQFSRGYEDYLQVPLQPLMDNLESCTYEIFEKDPIKYTEYQKAMYQAILDKVDEMEKEHKTVVLMVVGAGRGPLVRAALAAARKAERKIKIYAVEKNPNAVVTLQALQDEMWGESVTVVSSDMRCWNAPEKADILVSELLGSFGDNELSPECLDGVQKFLKDDGISIPYSYTSYIAPIQSAKLYSEVAQMREKDKHPLTPFEMPYVVRLHNRTELAEPQSLFTFHHPNYDPVIDNSRYQERNFHIKYNCMLHGFAGYFETVLYKDIILSIVPANHSPGMFSWFPIFFPIKDPVYLVAGSELNVHFWRCVSRNNVWYEWCITKPYASTVHNPNGRSYTIGL